MNDETFAIQISVLDFDQKQFYLNYIGDRGHAGCLQCNNKLGS